MFIVGMILAGAATVSALAAKPLADLAGLPTEVGLAVVFGVTILAAFAVNFAFGAVKSLAMLAVLAAGVGLAGWKLGYLAHPDQWLATAKQSAASRSKTNVDYGMVEEKQERSWTNPERINEAGYMDFGSGHYSR